MKRTHVLLASLALSAAALALRQDPPAKASKLDELAWLAGGWSTESDGKRIEEHWIAPQGGLMLGCGRTLANGRAVFFEFLRLEERKDGRVVYVAHPAGRSPGTDFELTSAKDGAWTFENPSHDFPKLIRYTRHDDGSVTAHLEGLERGHAASEDFHYSRIVK